MSHGVSVCFKNPRTWVQIPALMETARYLCLLGAEAREACWGLLPSQPRQKYGKRWVQPETLSRGSKTQSNRGAMHPPPLAAIHMGTLVSTGTNVCKMTKGKKKKPANQNHPNEKAHRSESGRILGMVTHCFCSVESGFVSSLQH